MIGFNGRVYKQLNELKQQNNEKDKLLAMIAHDLRAPLNAISYVLDKSIEQLSGTNTMLVALLENGKNYKDLLMALINDLIDYGQIKQGVWKIRYSHFNLQSILEQIQGMFKMQTEAKGINFQVLNKTGKLQIFSDEQRIKQVLINLLSNAVKFTVQGFVKIKVSYSKKNKENLLLFKVVDSGVGIQTETINKLGEQAYETHNQQGLNDKGIGLGLFICKKIIQQLGPNESFNIKSMPNEKTQFSFEIYYRQEKKKPLSFCKIFTEKGEMVRLNSAPIVSGTFQFNKLKTKKLRKETEVIEEGMETLAENFYDFNFGAKEAVNDEIDDLRRELLGVNKSFISEKKQEEEDEKEKAQEEERNFLLKDFNWANVIQKKHRSLSDEVKLLEDSIKDDNSDGKSKNFSSKIILNTANQINFNYDLESSNNIQEFNLPSSEEIQEIKKKSPYYFKEKNIQTKGTQRKIRSPCQQQKQLTATHLTRIQSQPIDIIPQIQLLNILIADDDPFNLLILSQYLEKLKGQYRITIHKAYHGGQAVNIFSKLNDHASHENLNYIILDCQMPIMDGYNASLLIKEKVEKENYMNVVVIGYTAEVGEEVEEKCKSVNMDGYILKPASEKQFLDYLLSYLN